MDKHTRPDVQAETKRTANKPGKARMHGSNAGDGPPSPSEGLVEELWLHQQELETQNKALRDVQLELETSRDQYALLYDAAPVGYVTLEASGRVRQANLTASQLLGVERAELSRSLLTTHIARADAAALLAHVGKSIGGERGAMLEVALRHPVEERAFLRLVSAPLPSSDAQSHVSCLTAIMNVTQTRRLQEERERMERKLQETQRLESLGVLTGGIAHDFNNLLAAILGRASLGSMVPNLDPALQDHFCQIEIAAERAADLCRQMMSYAGRGKFSGRPIDLNQLLRAEELLLRASIHHGTRLDFELQAELPMVHGDATQLRQLVMNLVSNASESAEPRGPHVVVRTRVANATRTELASARIGSDLAAGRYVVLEVRDDGAGMEAATLNKIFDPFFSTKFAGRGLGLAVVLGIIRRHSAALHVESAVGVGTTFRCWLPLATDPAASIADAPLPSKFQGAGTILLVDDDDAVRATSKLMLERIGFEVLAAASGRQALTLFAQHRDTIRAVVLDLSMPDMDGREVFRSLLSEEPSVRVLLMSGFDRRVALQGFGRTRPAGFTQKPLRVAALRRALEKLLRQPRVRSPAS
jgi:signal transduction histidine kinase/CheY-like chemotaxis protein